MRPIFANDPPTAVIFDFGTMPWDAALGAPADAAGAAAKLYAQALKDNGMTVPDPFVPPKTPLIPFLDFVNLFTQPEQMALMSSSDPQIRLMVAKAASTMVDLTNQEVIDGVNYLAAQGIIAPARVSVILDSWKA